LRYYSDSKGLFYSSSGRLVEFFGRPNLLEINPLPISSCLCSILRLSFTSFIIAERGRLNSGPLSSQY